MIVGIWDLKRIVVVGDVVVGDCEEKRVASPQESNGAVEGDHQQEGAEDLEQREIHVSHRADLFAFPSLGILGTFFLLSIFQIIQFFASVPSILAAASLRPFSSSSS